MDVQFERVSPPSCATLTHLDRSTGTPWDSSFEGEEGDYRFTHKLEGTKHFGLWPLSEAANVCLARQNGPRTSLCPRPASSSKSLTSPPLHPNSQPRAYD